LGFGIHVVKLGSAFAYTLYPIILHSYVRKRYKIDYTVKPDNLAIKQRWDAFFHQVAYFVTTNTDTIVLTVFANIKEVYVYSVYNLVIVAIRKFSTSFTNGLESAFGNMIAGEEKRLLRENFMIVETMTFAIGSFVCIVAGVMIVPFVNVYTKNVVDVQYSRPLFATIMIAGQFLETIRQPYQILIQAAGKYKETKRIVIFEPLINISISILLVIRFGLVGVAVGTFVSILIRTFGFSSFISEHFIEGTLKRTLQMIMMAVVDAVFVYIVYYLLKLGTTMTFVAWVGHTLIVSAITLIVVFCSLTLLRRNELIKLISKIKTIIVGKKRG